MEFKKTRNDELRLKRLRDTVLYGESILKKKTVLLTTTLLMSLVNYQGELGGLNSHAREAAKQIDFALSVDGVQSILSASNTITASYSLDFKNENLIGTFIPSFVMKDLAIRRGYGDLATSLRIEQSSKLFGGLVTELVTSAGIYIRIRKLSEAISRTRARYNSLNKKLLPSLEKQYSQIDEFLESTEQREGFALRNFLETTGTRY